MAIKKGSSSYNTYFIGRGITHTDNLIVNGVGKGTISSTKTNGS
jgi:hypothetical protein